ncbi:Sugar transporter ERD6-like 18 [Vitis vinifera]|uniref:Sugar transporter ERD6-like 18 n=1 Tax=Vitis vinifera TaxID=29760 RepID=A0A438FY13_VITVI|nr:Sugar transporter ERD6-like 18 [Vitis vinifera]
MDTASIGDGLLIEEKAPGELNGGIGGSSCGASSSVTAVVVFSTAVAVCASFTCGCSAGYSSPAESGIVDDLGLSVAQYSVFGSILTVGGIIGSAASGKITDLLGRRRTLWYSDVFLTMGTYIYHRNYTQGPSERVCISGHGAIPCILQVIGLFFIPESPRWLVRAAKIGRDKELETALQRLRGMDTNISQEAAEIKDYTETFHQLSENRFIDLFQRKYVHSLTTGVGLMVLPQFGGSVGNQASILCLLP